MQTTASLAQHFANLSIFTETVFPLTFVILACDLALSAFHSFQELRGHMWRYVGAIAGVRIPDIFGVTLFFVALTLLLWSVGVAGIVGLPFVSEIVQAGAVWCMIGFRTSDSWNLHYKLARQGYVPNPGLPSAPFYLLEAAILAVVFLPALAGHPVAAVIGLGLGWLFFLSVMPIVRHLPQLFPKLGQAAWQAGQSIPSSAR